MSLRASCRPSEEFPVNDSLVDVNDGSIGSLDFDFAISKVSERVKNMANVSGLTKGGIDAEQLGKVWRIDAGTAKPTIDITSQHRRHAPTNCLFRNYGTSDCAVRYKRFHELFYMDTFFAAKHGGKSSHGHTCCQLFVTGFVYVVPMRRKKDVLIAVKQFAKVLGVPERLSATCPASNVTSNQGFLFGSWDSLITVGTGNSLDKPGRTLHRNHEGSYHL